jgi:Domain of unknown function (DUF4157)
LTAYDYEPESQRGRRPDELPPEQAADLAAAQRLASAVGNQAFGALARQGAGILPDGRAHPDVEAAIARTRGSGQRLDEGARDTIGGPLGDPLDDVRVHTDAHAHELAQAVSARAFTTGSDVYFARGEYNPGSSEGRRLLTHELTHVVQQRGASASGPLQVSQPQDALEREAEATADELLG